MFIPKGFSVTLVLWLNVNIKLLISCSRLTLTWGVGELQPVPRDHVHLQLVLPELAVRVRTPDVDLVSGLRGKIKHNIGRRRSSRRPIVSVDSIVFKGRIVYKFKEQSRVILVLKCHGDLKNHKTTKICWCKRKDLRVLYFVIILICVVVYSFCINTSF